MVDLCAAPGSWSQVLSRVLIKGEKFGRTAWHDREASFRQQMLKVFQDTPVDDAPETPSTTETPPAEDRKDVKIVSIDLQPISPLPGVVTLRADITHPATVPLLLIDDLGMKRLPHTAAEDLLELVMRRYERASTILTSNRPVDDWGKLLGDTAAVTALLDRLLHHAHVLKCGPRSWRTKVQTDLRTETAVR